MVEYLCQGEEEAKLNQERIGNERENRFMKRENRFMKNHISRNKNRMSFKIIEFIALNSKGLTFVALGSN